MVETFDAGPAPVHTLPWVRALGLPGRRLSMGYHREGQRLVVEQDELNRLGGRGLVDGRNRRDALGSPWYTGSSVRAVSGGSGGGGGAWPPGGTGGAGGAGKSLARRMPFTPGSASARLASTLTTRACGIGESSSLTNSMPSAR